MSTTTILPTLQNTLDKGIDVPGAAQAMGLGTMLAPLKRAFTGLTASGTCDLTATDGTGETVGAGNANRLPLLALRSLRVTAATTATTVGSYILTDAGGNTVSATTHTVVGICLISDDGKTITFPTADVTAFVIEYIPRSKVDMTLANEALGGAP